MIRVLEVWHQQISPGLRAGRRILIVAPGNTQRALVKYLDGVADEASTELNISTGGPLVYEFNSVHPVMASDYLEATPHQTAVPQAAATDC